MGQAAEAARHLMAGASLSDSGFDLNDKHILVTGGGGFIGSRLVELLLARRSPASLTVVDKFTYAGDRENLNDVREQIILKELDVCDEALGFDVRRPDVIFHLAAETHVDRSIENGLPFAQVDFYGTAVMLEWARQWGSRFVFVSTDEVYGDMQTREIDVATEDTALAPNNPYSAAKAGADFMVQAYHRTHGLDTVILRPANQYGPRQYPEKLFPHFVYLAMSGQDLTVHGDGAQLREYTHVNDGAMGILLAGERGASGSIFNIASEEYMTVNEVALAVLHHFGLAETRIAYVEDRPGGDARYSISSARARKELGWEPKVPLDRGVSHTIGWYAGKWANELPEVAA